MTILPPSGNVKGIIPPWFCPCQPSRHKIALDFWGYCATLWVMRSTEDYLTVTEAAEYCRVDRQTIRRRILGGELPTYPAFDRRKKLLLRADLDRLMGESVE